MELLRVTMNAKQVREACQAYAADRSKFGDQLINVLDVPDELVVTVSFKKRYARTKPAKTAGLSGGANE